MRLVCPCCGAVASLEGWANDATSRTFMGELLRLPRQVQDMALPYLGLFRQGKQGLSWPRALRLIGDLVRLIETGTIRWDGGEERPAPPQLWAQALDAVLARRPNGLSNHNYLRHVAFELARSLAAQAEANAQSKALARTYVPEEPDRAADEPAGREQIRELADAVGRMGGGKTLPNCYTCPMHEGPNFCRREFAQTKRMAVVRPVDGCDHHPRRRKKANEDREEAT